MDEITNNPMTLSPGILLGAIGGYFLMLIFVAYWTSRNATNSDFFSASKQSPWYLVAFGMIGASLSGVTFISIPGTVGAVYLKPELGTATNMQFSYLQMVMGYLAGYAVIATILLPLYYRLNLTSIYTYLEQRFGVASYKTGAAFFMISRMIGSSFRLYLVAVVLYTFVFEPWGFPFWGVSLITIILILVYTYKGGIKTIVWTDTLQTVFMLVALVLTIVELARVLNIPMGNLWATVQSENLGQIFFFEGGWSDPNNFFKQFFAGMFIAIAMTGLDQDMMQKNLTCRTLQDAQKNMFSFSIVLFFVNFIFLVLGALLAIYALRFSVEFGRSDNLYPTLALRHLPWEIGLIFIIGLIAAAYSSADSALTALTTSFCVDFLGFKTNIKTKTMNSNISTENILDANNQIITDEEEERNTRTRHRVHIGFSVLSFLMIILFWMINDDSVINNLFKIAGYTYGPLLGLYTFGLFTKYPVHDKIVPLVCISTPIITYIINLNSVTWLWGYKFGFELLLLNGTLTFLGLWLVRKK